MNITFKYSHIRKLASSLSIPSHHDGAEKKKLAESPFPSTWFGSSKRQWRCWESSRKISIQHHHRPFLASMMSVTVAAAHNHPNTKLFGEKRKAAERPPAQIDTGSFLVIHNFLVVRFGDLAASNQMQEFCLKTANSFYSERVWTSPTFSPIALLGNDKLWWNGQHRRFGWGTWSL